MKTKKMKVPLDYHFIPSSQPSNWQYHFVVKNLQSGVRMLDLIYDSIPTMCVDLGKLLKLLVLQFTCLKNRYFNNMLLLREA